MMDQPDLDRAAHERALRGLARTNCWGSTRRIMWKAIRDIARRRRLDELRILDIASGAGDFAVWMKRQCERHGLKVLIDGCDKSTTAVEFASRQAAAAGLEAMRFFCCDVLNDPLPSTYDVMACSLFLHHLDETEAVALLAKLAAAARHAVLVDDLQRSVRGYGLACVGCAALARSPVVSVDAPRSVRAAFSEREVRALLSSAGWQGAVVRRHWPQRYLITWEKPWTATNRSNG
jgi:2-polyprenyl-3-methyl-5-hydroxy-6-metoxy-1,4-benzoquinol methylase